MTREWRDGLPSEARIITFVGGGGKTQLMMELAGGYAHAGQKVLVTTTTHMFFPGSDKAIQERQYPDDMEWLICGKDRIYTRQGKLDRDQEDTKAWWDRCRAILMDYMKAGKMVLTGCPEEGNPHKITGLPDFVRRDFASLADICLIEGDGSARKPVKIPRAWEPVVPKESQVTVAVLGMRALGEKIGQVSYAPEEMAAFLGKCLEDPLTGEDILRILTHPQGLKKGSRGQYYVILNQADTSKLRRQSENILRGLEKQGIPGHWATRRQRLGLVLLAAGLGRRFQGSEKMRAKLPDGRSLYEKALEIAEEIPADRYVFVTREEELGELVSRRSFVSEGQRQVWRSVVNPEPERGIASSMQCGIRASGDVDGWLFMVCDQPRLSACLVQEIVEAWRGCRGDIISASCMGRPGNPKLFSAVFREELMALSGDVGGRQILKNHTDALYFVETSHPEELYDVDTKEDLDRIGKIR